LLANMPLSPEPGTKAAPVPEDVRVLALAALDAVGNAAQDERNEERMD
jgi:hypothetical protein